jgi:hypothetical protein
MQLAEHGSCKKLICLFAVVRVSDYLHPSCGEINLLDVAWPP